MQLCRIPMCHFFWLSCTKFTSVSFLIDPPIPNNFTTILMYILIYNVSLNCKVAKADPSDIGFGTKLANGDNGARGNTLGRSLCTPTVGPYTSIP